MRKERFLQLALLALMSIATFGAKAQQPYTNPAGNKFPIVAWYELHNEQDASKARFQKLAEGGFTLSLTGFENISYLDSALDAMKGTGIKLILSNSNTKNNPLKAKNFVTKNKDKEGIAMWYIRDEPSWNQIDTCKPIVDAVNYAKLPSQISYVNLLPTYADKDSIGPSYEKYLEKAIHELSLPFISYDHYPVHDTLDRPTQTWKTVFTDDFYYNFEEVRKVCNKNDSIPFWAFCMSSAHQEPGGDTRYTTPSLGLLKLEAYAALAYGAQGLQYYRIAAKDRDNLKFTNVPIDSDGNTNFVWNHIKTVNQKIQKHASIFLGNKVKNTWLFKPIKKKEFSIGDIIYTAPLPSQFSSITEYNDDGVLVSHFTNGNRNFLMIVNKDYKQAQTVSVKRDSNVRLVNADGIFIRDNHVDFSVPAGDYILFTWV